MKDKQKQGFTLIEALLVIAIIGVLTSMSLLVLADAANSAKVSRAKVQIRKINDLVMDRWESFETRPIPFKLDTNLFPALLDPRNAARVRLYAIRELMRLELPDRFTDITAGSVNVTVPMDNGTTVNCSIGNNSLNDFYQRNITATATTQFQGAECLYMVLASIQDEYGNGLDAFSDDEIGDLDGDGMPEIQDPWGMPIEFLRWAPGFSELASDYEGVIGQWSSAPALPDTVYPTTRQRSPIQSNNSIDDPDPFDPLSTDPRLNRVTTITTPPFDDPADNNARNDTFRLVPLIYSAGPNRSYDVWRRDEEDFDFYDFGSGFTLINYTATPPMDAQLLNDPYAGRGLGAGPANDDTPSVGFRIDIDGDQIEGYIDNIDNHFGLEN